MSQDHSWKCKYCLCYEGAIKDRDKKIADLEAALKQSCEDSRSTMYSCPLQADNERLRGKNKELADALNLAVERLAQAGAALEGDK